jgi:hypothetical protein
MQTQKKKKEKEKEARLHLEKKVDFLWLKIQPSAMVWFQQEGVKLLLFLRLFFHK